MSLWKNHCLQRKHCMHSQPRDLREFMLTLCIVWKGSSILPTAWGLKCNTNCPGEEWAQRGAGSCLQHTLCSLGSKSADENSRVNLLWTTWSIVVGIPAYGRGWNEISFKLPSHPNYFLTLRRNSFGNWNRSQTGLASNGLLKGTCF